MKVYVRLGLVLSALALLGGCASGTAVDCLESPTAPECLVAPECRVPADCGEPGQACVEGRCVAALAPECAIDGECGASEVCISGDCRAAAGPCAADGECAATEFCEPERDRCVEGCRNDGSCALGQTCDPTARSCGFPCGPGEGCPGGFLCDASAGRCLPDPAACDPAVAASCADGQGCDPFARRCGGAPGAVCAADGECLPGSRCTGDQCTPDPSLACADDAACAPPLVCRLTLGADGRPSSACGGAFGSGRAGQACTSGGDCAAGVCLAEGLCYGACDADADCSSVDPGNVCGQALVLDSAGAPAATPACLEAVTPCASDSGCGAFNEVCTVRRDPRDATAVVRSCDDRRGAVANSAACGASAECESGVCLGGFCYEACGSAADCRDGWACSPITFSLAGGGSGAVEGCLPARACAQDATCLAVATDEFCSPIVAATGDQLELLCFPGDPARKRAGEPCVVGDECATGICLSAGRCYGACDGSGGCGVDTTCVQVTFGLPGGGVDDAPGCLLPCTDFAGCAAAQRCGALPRGDDPTHVQEVCLRAVPPGENLPGEECAANADCLSGTCLNTTPRVCLGVCDGDDDCPAGIQCYQNFVSIRTVGDPAAPAATDKFDSTSSCAPDIGSLDPCSGSDAADCPAGEVCTLTTNAEQTAFLGVCSRNVGAKAPGAACGADAECKSGVCLRDTNNNPLLCLGVCDADGTNECVNATTCQSQTFTVRTGVTDAILICK